ncbi:HNH endonuclease [Halorubrum alkaliphilum]|uniref:HNH endonuclease n=1 Tax=Halorubrum alkaliphilum TaxID=261290 RepID=UPI002AA2B69C|nr:HNH endonuclease [Halorubrum alkaliphilum]
MPACQSKQHPTRTIRIHTLRKNKQQEKHEPAEVTVSDAFRTETLDYYDHACTLTGIREDELLNLAHILPRSQRPELAEHPESVLVLNSLHHRAFDAALSTIASDYRIQTSSSFDPAHPFLRETILDRNGDQLARPPTVQIQPSFLNDLNAGLSWLS